MCLFEFFYYRFQSRFITSLTSSASIIRIDITFLDDDANRHCAHGGEKERSTFVEGEEETTQKKDDNKSFVCGDDERCICVLIFVNKK